MKADCDFFAATKERKADGWMEFMTEETTVSRDKPYSGLQAIRATMSEDYKDPRFQLTWDPETAVMLESGNMGYTYGPLCGCRARPQQHDPQVWRHNTSPSGRSRKMARGKCSGTVVHPRADQISRLHMHPAKNISDSPHGRVDS